MTDSLSIRGYSDRGPKVAVRYLTYPDTQEPDNWPA